MIHVSECGSYIESDSPGYPVWVIMAESPPKSFLMVAWCGLERRRVTGASDLIFVFLVRHCPIRDSTASRPGANPGRGLRTVYIAYLCMHSGSFYQECRCLFVVLRCGGFGGQVPGAAPTRGHKWRRAAAATKKIRIYQLETSVAIGERRTGGNPSRCVGIPQMDPPPGWARRPPIVTIGCGYGPGCWDFAVRYVSRLLLAVHANLSWCT